MIVPGPVELRRGVLAVSVLHDLDVLPADDGVVLPGVPPVHVGWAECRHALAGHDPEAPDGRERLARWLLARRRAADLHPDELAARLRPVGLPVEHLLHPGLDWVCTRVLGGALDLGLGVLGLDPASPDAVDVVPPPALADAGLDAAAAWVCAAAVLEDRGTVAADLLARDGRGRLRPVGGCDVVTLLGARSLRAAVAGDAAGLGTAVVPMRTRGWTQLALVDPAFGAAAAAATAPADRGFPRPLLVTAEELTMPAPGGRPEDLALRQPAADAPWLRDVLYR